MLLQMFAKVQNQQHCIFSAQATAIFAFAHLQQIADPLVFLAAEFLFS